MADESNQQEANRAPRVYKASEVHKRSATKRSHSKPASAPSSEEARSSEPPIEKPQREAGARVREATVQEPKGEASPRESEQPAPEQNQKQSRLRSRRKKPEASQAKGQAQAEEHTQEQGDDQEQGEGQEQSQSQERPRRRMRNQEQLQDQEPDEPHVKLWVRILRIFGLAVAALLLVSVGYIAADRWLIHNDQASMIGEWHVSNTTVPVVISDSTIKLNPETTYEYTIDTTAKTITYRFGELQGEGHYWFSPDRRTLVITDGKDLNAVGTLFDDIAHGIRDAFDNAFSGGATIPSGDGIIALTRA